MSIKLNRTMSILGITVIVSCILQFIFRGNVKLDIIDIAFGYYIINFFSTRQSKVENNANTTNGFEKHGLLAVTIVFLSLSLLPTFILTSFDLLSAGKLFLYSIIKLAIFIGIGVIYNKHTTKNAESNT